MQNKFTLAVVVIVAVFLGVTITVQQSNSPVMRRLVAQQEEILSLQKKIDRVLSEGGSANASQGGSADIASINSKIDAIITTLKPLQQMQRAQQAPQEPTDEYTKVHVIDIGKSPIKGNKEAPVTIVEFMDIQCPFCARFHPVVNEVLAAYPDKVNFVLKNFPLSFHQQARPAAKAALAAGEQGKYYEMLELLLQNAQNLTDEKFKELAKTLELNVDKFTKDLKDKDAEWEQMINGDIELGGKVEVRGTPTYYINGRKTMARNLEMYKKEIDEILNKK